MALRVKDPVEFARKMTFGSQDVPAGTRAYIAQLTIENGPVWVSVPSIRREVIVPLSALRAVSPTHAAAMSGDDPSGTATVCRFDGNDNVRLAITRQYGNDLVQAGSKGSVTQVIPLAVACLYWVRWKGLARDVIVPESDLI